MALAVKDPFEVVQSAINTNDVLLALRHEVVGEAPIFTIKNFLAASACAVYYQHISRELAAGKFIDYGESPPRYGLHNDEVALPLAYFLRASVEVLTKMSLQPSWTFCAVYPEGSELSRHIDRAECEVTVAIYIQRSHAHLDPRVLLNFGPTSRPTVFKGSIGDAVIFFGRRTAHWRYPSPVEGDSLTTLLLHYS